MPITLTSGPRGTDDGGCRRRPDIALTIEPGSDHGTQRLDQVPDGIRPTDSRTRFDRHDLTADRAQPQPYIAATTDPGAAAPHELAPVIVRALHDPKLRLTFRVPYAFTVTRTHDGLLAAEDEDIHLAAVGETREQLVDDISEEILLHWRGIVEEDDSRLSPGARVLKRRLRDLLREKPVAAR